MSLTITITSANRFEQDDNLRAIIYRDGGGGLFFDAATREGAIQGVLKLLTAVEAAEARQPGARADEDLPLGLSRRVAVSPLAIRTLLQDAMDKSDQVEIDYEDAEGHQTTRRIEPRNFRDSAAGWDKTALVYSYDHLSNEMRSFRLDRIKRVEDT